MYPLFEVDNFYLLVTLEMRRTGIRDTDIESDAVADLAEGRGTKGIRAIIFS
jgi:hypothetical protein